MRLLWEDRAWEDYLYWQMQDKKTIKRINKLLQSIEREGALSGIGKPEVLKHDMSGMYSRRIDDENRLVYKISETQIIVYKCKGHYEDK